MSKNRIFSGVQPTGSLHLGNYLGAIRNWVRLQDTFEAIYCVVDLHAITATYDYKELAHATREVTASLIATGIDPKKSIIFNQSMVKEHAELAWLFSCVARIGWLNRMTQFKDKAGKNREQATVGLYAYPVLMAADILAYKATHVPVGEDQKQHLELTRDIAQTFNSNYGVNFFPIPEPQILGSATRVMSLRDGTKKMSKSEDSDLSRINLTDTNDQIVQKIRKAKTDPNPLPDNMIALKERAEALNLVTIYAALRDIEIPKVLNEFQGHGFSTFKQALIDLTIDQLTPIRDEMNRLTKEAGEINRVLGEGAVRASSITAPVLEEVRKLMGFLNVQK